MSRYAEDPEDTESDGRSRLGRSGPPAYPRAAVMASGRGSNFGALAAAFAAGEIPGSIELLIVDQPLAGALQIAKDHEIPALCVERKRRQRSAFDAAILRALEAHRIDYIFLAGFMRILSRSVVEEYWGRILNIHPSLLPDFPGLRPHAQALAAGVEESGCSVHFVDFGVDTGPVILQRRVAVLPDDDEESLAARILEQEHVAYPEAARRVLRGEVRMGDPTDESD